MRSVLKHRGLKRNNNPMENVQLRGTQQLGLRGCQDPEDGMCLPTWDSFPNFRTKTVSMPEKKLTMSQREERHAIFLFPLCSLPVGVRGWNERKQASVPGVYRKGNGNQTVHLGSSISYHNIQKMPTVFKCLEDKNMYMVMKFSLVWNDRNTYLTFTNS